MESKTSPIESEKVPISSGHGVARRDVLTTLGLGAVGAAAVGIGLKEVAGQEAVLPRPVSGTSDIDIAHFNLIVSAWVTRRLTDLWKDGSWSADSIRYITSADAWGPVPLGRPTAGFRPREPRPTPGDDGFLQELRRNLMRPDRPDLPDLFEGRRITLTSGATRSPS